MKYLRAASLGAALVLLLTACPRDASGPNSVRCLEPGPTQTGTTPIVIGFQAPSQVAAGMPVRLRLTVTNTANEPVLLGLGGDPTDFDFVVTRTDGTLVWERMHGLDFDLVLGEYPIAAGQSLHFEHTWDQRDNKGRRVAPGTYSVFGVLFPDLPGVDRCYRTEAKFLTIIS